MEHSGLQKIDTVARLFIKLFPIFASILIFIGAIFVLYKNTGVAEYQASLSYLNKLSEYQKITKSVEFFEPVVDQNLRGGILAGTWNNNLFMWGRSGLMHYTIDNISRFVLVTKCPTDLTVIDKLVGRVDSSKLPPSAFPEMETFPNIYDWRAKVRPGSYIQVNAALNDNTRLRSVTAYSEFKAPKNWVFCKLYWEQK